MRPSAYSYALLLSISSSFTVIDFSFEIFSTFSSQNAILEGKLQKVMLGSLTAVSLVILSSHCHICTLSDNDQSTSAFCFIAVVLLLTLVLCMRAGWTHKHSHNLRAISIPAH